MRFCVSPGSTQQADIKDTDEGHAFHDRSADNTVHPSTVNGGTRAISDTECDGDQRALYQGPPKLKNYENILVHIYVFEWAITKNGCTRSLFSQKRVHSKIK